MKNANFLLPQHNTTQHTNSLDSCSLQETFSFQMRFVKLGTKFSETFRLKFVSSVLLIFSFLLSVSDILAQTRPCFAVPCSKLKVEAIRVYPNVGTNCASPDPGKVPNAASCGNYSSQVFFAVYLKYINTAPGTSPADFDLDYSDLDVKVNLQNTGSNQRSYIDVNSTKTCFENSPNGINWSAYSNTDGDKVIFTPTEKSVDISFKNMNSSDHCGTVTSGGGTNKIPFSYTNDIPSGASCGGPINSQCAYARLFIVVVNAWPGESVFLDLDVTQSKYTPVGSSCDDPIARETSGTSNAFGSGSAISSPSTYVGTQNASLELQMSGPVLTNGKQEFTLNLANTNSSDNINVVHLDFFVKVSLRNNGEILSYSGAYQPVSKVYKGADPNNSGYNYYLLHYVITGLGTINSSTTSTLGKIQIPNPTLTSLNWNIKLVTEGGRLNTIKSKNGVSTLACTNVNPVSNVNYDVTNLAEFCSDAGIVFDIVKTVNTDCATDFAYNVGLRALSPAQTRNITTLKFDLVFDMDPGAAISGVDVSSSHWDNPCTAGNCITTSDCYAYSGNTFQYCFSTGTPNAAIFTLNDFKYVQIKFSHTGNACIRGVKITNLIINYSNGGVVAPACVLPILPSINPNTQKIDLTLCGPKLYGSLATEINNGVQDVTIKAAAPSNTCATCSGTCIEASELTNATGQYGFCSLCSTCSKFTLTPTKNDNPLNGVSTFDLVLISKHILGIETLNSPYKIIAADANKSQSVTSFDIIELRKLLLGIYSALPNNTSWRFVSKDFTFPNVLNPFQTMFDEFIACADPTQVKPFDFVAIKVGDVNNNAITNAKPSDRPITTISWANTGAKSATTLSIPVMYTGLETLEALQLGLKFDPLRYELIGTAPGDLSGYTSANFGLTQASKGEIRTLWFPFQNPDERIKPGTVLFYLNFKVLKGGADATFELSLDNNLLSNLAWQQDGTVFSISGTPTSERIPAEVHKSENTLQVNVQPNPSSGAVSMTINAPQAMKARIVLFSADGQRVLFRDVTLSEGEQLADLSEVLNMPAGIYTWKVYAGGSEAHGQLVKN
ncbi:MAG: T9SS type A sorting domain-containing protein [Saprospiraceae bacterium]|nr:T9SS type A sorting domain-containing protein [Saprospiraceae bacterium]